MNSKQKLTPELKAIYERVMNTKVGISSPTTTTLASKPVQAPVSKFPASAQSSAFSALAKTTPSAQDVKKQPTTAPQPSGGFVFSTPISHPNSSAGHIPQTVTGSITARKSGAGIKLAVFAGIVFFVFYTIFWLKLFKYL